MPNDVVLSVGADTTDFKSTIGGLASDLTSSISSINPAVAAAVGVVAGIGVAAFNVGKDFEAAFNSIRVGTGATGENLEGLKTDFREVFAGVPEDAATVSGAIGDLNTKLGLSGKPLQDLSTQFLNLARINKEDVSGAIDSTSKAFNAWGVEADAQGDKLDTLFNISQATGVSVSDLSASTADAASTGKTLGLTFDETAALIGNLEKTTGDSSGSMRRLTRAVAEMADEGIPAKDALTGIFDSIKNAENDTEAGGLAIEMFGTRGVEMAEKIRSGKFDIDELLTSISDSPDTINGVAEDVATFGEKFDTLGNQVSLLLEPLGTLLVDGLTAVADFLVENLNPAMEFLGELWGGLLTFIQPVTDYFRNNVLPALQSVGEVWLGLHLLLRDMLIPVFTAVWNAIKPIVTIIKDEVVFQIKAFFQNIETLIGWLAKIPGVSDLVKAAQDRVKTAFKDTGTEADTAKGKVETFSGMVDKSREAQDKVGAAGGSAPKLAAATRDVGAAHSEAKVKVEEYKDAQNDAVAASNRAYAAELALKGQTDALKTAFENVEQPVIDVGTAVTGVDNSVLAVTSSMANADIAGSLEQWKTDAETELPKVKGPFEDWAEGVSSIVGSLSTGLTSKLFTDPGSFGAEALGKLKTIGQSFLDVFDAQLFGPEGVITKFINQGLGTLMGALDGLISKITGGVGGALSSVFGGATSAAGNAAGKIGGSSVPSVPTGGGGGGGGLGGLAAGANPVTGIITAAAGVADAIIGGFQRSEMNGKLTLIEENTRALSFRTQGGVLDTLIFIKTELLFGNLVKAVEDFRSKFWDTGVPILRALEIQGGYIQPTLDSFGRDYFSQWGSKFDSIVRNTERTAVAVERMGGGRGLTINDITTAAERNEGGFATNLQRALAGRGGR